MAVAAGRADAGTAVVALLMARIGVAGAASRQRRVEGRIGLEETFKRWPRWTVDRASTVLLYTSTVRGPLNLPIEV